MLTVQAFCINKDTPAQHYILATVPENRVLYSQPNGGWKTIKGAYRWAIRHGYNTVEGQDNIQDKNKARHS